MIKHIVMFKLKQELSEQEREDIIQKSISITSCFEKEIATVISCKIVSNSSLAPVSNYDLALLCEFEDIAGLDFYQQHPRHLEFGEFIVNVRDSRACIDFEV